MVLLHRNAEAKPQGLRWNLQPHPKVFFLDLVNYENNVNSATFLPGAELQLPALSWVLESRLPAGLTPGSSGPLLPSTGSAAVAAHSGGGGLPRCSASLATQERRGSVTSAALGSSPDPSRPSHKPTVKHFAFLHPNLYREAPNPATGEALVPFALQPAHTALRLSWGLGTVWESLENHGLPFVAVAPGKPSSQMPPGSAYDPPSSASGPNWYDTD